jgi:hypothetical protein
MNVPEPPSALLVRRRALYALKIQQEEQALSSATFGPGNPADYKSTPGHTREQRLAEWQAVLSQIEDELDSLGIRTSPQNRKFDPPHESASDSYLAT